MDGIEKASKDVEESIAFPKIEWPVYEGEDNCESEDVSPPKLKRPRFGLVRSQPSFNLVELERSESLLELSSQSLLELHSSRMGSSGSLC